ncbi:MAG: class I SAM-dependent methyltransferase [Anaerolineae bacterium]|nr:class I SAM-dependent methyltransferase [Anaerolineae bacterium]
MSDLDRLRHEYADRNKRLAADRYSLFNGGHLLNMQQRQRDSLDLLNRHGISSLQGKRVLEVGCGRGEALLQYVSFGAAPENTFGIDLLPDRLRELRHILPTANVACADGQQLPYAADQFDVVLQHTAFSSILDAQIKANIAREMLRVLRKPDGVIVWYDFWLNPTNRQTKGIRPAEIRQLFPDCEITFRKVTLALPLARKLANISWILCVILEKMWLLNTHYLAIIRHVGTNLTP